MMFAAEIENLIKFFQADYAQFSSILDAKYGGTPEEYSIRVQDNPKYIKLVTNRGSVVGFISKGLDGKFKAGDLLKAATWRAPAMNFSRGSVLDPAVWPAHVRWTGIQ